MRAKDFIVESNGLFGRSTGDQFANDDGEILTFQTIETYPDSESDLGDRFSSQEEMQGTIDFVQDQYQTEIEWVNKTGYGTGAFAVAVLMTQDEKTVLWGRWYKSVPENPLRTWGNNQIPPRWKLQTGASKKARSGLSPQDLIQTDKQAFGKTNDIIDKVSPGLNPEVNEGLSMIAAGTLPAVFKGQKKNLEAIRDNFGEIIQPVALMKGLVGGDADKAAMEVLEAPFSQCKVVWPQSKTQGLIDSYFIGPNGRTLGISSKGKDGANASVNNIHKAIEEAKIKKPDLIKKHAKAIRIIEIINERSQKEGPVALAFYLGMIDEHQAQEIMELVNVPSKRPKLLSQASRELMSTYSGKTDHPRYSVGLALLAALARQVCTAVNNMPEFGNACLDFINQAALIQVYTDAKAVGEDVHITGFRSIYPPNFSGSVILTATKTYYATNINGKFTFDYNPTKKG
jgi:hypothetical protein